MTRSTGQRFRWSPDEIEQALSLAGDVPWPLVPLLYNRWAKANNRPRRTEPALRQRVDASGSVTTATGTWLTAGSVATILGLHPCIPSGWADRWHGILQPYQPASKPGAKRRGRVYLKRDRIRAFARQHPEQFGGIKVLIYGRARPPRQRRKHRIQRQGLGYQERFHRFHVVAMNGLGFLPQSLHTMRQTDIFTHVTFGKFCHHHGIVEQAIRDQTGG